MGQLFRGTVVIAALLLGGGLSPAQESASHRLDEHVFNAGGHPLDGASPESASHRLSIDALGDAMHADGVSSASHGLTIGFSWSYAPPGEVLGLLLGIGSSLSWQPEPSVGLYNLYRGSLGDFALVACEQRDIEAATTTDLDPLPPGDGFFYLVTAENLLGEEGTSGSRSDGTTRPAPVACP